MRKGDFWAAYLLLLLAQLLLSNFFTLTPYLMLSILPVMVLCIPIRVGTSGAMLIAFATGMAVDLLSEGLLGLNAFALVPVAFLRYPIIKLVFGTELFARGEDFSPRRNGLWKTVMATVLAQAAFTLIYVLVDGAASNPFWFDAARFFISLLAGTVLSLACLPSLAPDTRK